VLITQVVSLGMFLILKFFPPHPASVMRLYIPEKIYPWTNILPHSSRDAQMLIEDVKRIVHELDQGQQLSSIGVELVDNELAILYMNSKKSEVMLEPHP
jgi:hypothetical protein